MGKVIIRISGGLGNQLFQFAFGESLRSLGQPIEILYDTSFYAARDQKFPRELILNLFLDIPLDLNIEPIGVSPNLWSRIYFALKRKNTWVRKVSRRVLYNQYLLCGNVIKEEFKFGYNELISKRFAKINLQKQDFVLEGYWCDYRYFSNIIKRLSQKLVMKALSEDFMTMKKKIQEDDIMLHVRRGDYLTIGEGKEGIFIGIDYYKRGLAALQEDAITPNLRVVWIFSDDPEWCMRVFNEHLPQWIYNFEANCLSDAESFELMREFRYRIIANSTFSLWSYYLSKVESKQVVIPKDWIRTYANIGFQLIDERLEQILL